jgi:hypothetical protein
MAAYERARLLARALQFEPAMTNKFVLVTLSSTLFLASPVAALAGTAPSPETTVIATPAASSAAASDPNIDRGFIQPTAMTQPAGTLTYNNYELFLHGFTYGLTDNVQTSVTVLSPIATSMPFLGIAAVKWRMLSTGRVHVAAQASLGYAHELDSGSSGAGYSLGAGAFASLCLQDDCASLLSANATYQLLLGSASSDALHLIVYGGSVVHRVGAHVKLLGEVTSAAGRTSYSSLDNASGVLVSYGVRFHSDSIAGDVGFIKPIVSDDDGGLVMGLPFVSVSYRW